MPPHPTTRELKAELARLADQQPAPAANGHHIDREDPLLGDLRGLPMIGSGPGHISGTEPGSSVARLLADEAWLRKQANGGRPKRRRRDGSLR